MKNNQIEIEHIYNHPSEIVWKYLTEAELLEKWWVPSDIKAIEGYKFQLLMPKFGPQQCEVLRVELHKEFSFLFSKGLLDTTITWKLTPKEKKYTELKLIHAGFNLDHPMGRQAFEGMKSGWGQILDRLAIAIT